MIDDSDEPSRVGTPKPPVPDKDSDGMAHEDGEEKNVNEKDTALGEVSAADTTTEAKPEMSLETKTRLRKLEKLEKTYPGNKILLTYWSDVNA